MAETEESQTKPFSLPWLNSGLKQQVLEKQEINYHDDDHKSPGRETNED